MKVEVRGDLDAQTDNPSAAIRASAEVTARPPALSTRAPPRPMDSATRHTRVAEAAAGALRCLDRRAARAAGGGVSGLGSAPAPGGAAPPHITYPQVGAVTVLRLV
jgi:hypothetical protein